ncbi:MAG: preprotein translocase subunit YajC [Aureispira sp.]
MINNLFFLWQTAAPEAGSNPFLLPFMAIGIGVFYFFMIRPSIKEQKVQKNFTESLKKGNKVVTIGGVHGTIASVEENILTLLIAPKTVITVQRGSISQDATQAAYGEASAKSTAAAKA